MVQITTTDIIGITVLSIFVLLMSVFLAWIHTKEFTDNSWEEKLVN